MSSPSGNFAEALIGKVDVSNFDANQGTKTAMNKLLQECWDNSIACQHPDNFFNKKIDSVIDYFRDLLNIGHWSDVSLELRRAVTSAYFTQAIILLKSETHRPTSHLVKEALKSIDTGLLMGAPLEEYPDLLTSAASYLSEEICKLEKPRELPIQDRRKSGSYVEYESLKGREIETVSCPSLDYFNKNYFEKRLPVKIQNCLSHWPAVSKWPDINYLIKIAGNRTVPVEIGSHYTDENWSQKLMTVADFWQTYCSEQAKEVGYLAQHNLFNQIAELKDDIRVPEYCALSRDYENCSEPDINAWFGPKGTVSPLHYDPKDNLLAQVLGEKQIILFAPEDSEFLYPYETKMLFNTARVDPVQPNLTACPDFPQATLYKCILREKEMLYIPVNWWHHVTALERSFSVSFWWQ